MYVKLNVYLLMCSRISAFLENFQKSPGGWWITARRLICVSWFWGSGRETAWRHIPGRQATHGVLIIFWILGWRA